MHKKVILVSDGTGETAAQMIKAARVQFPSEDVSVARFKNVRNEHQLDAICEEAVQSTEKPLIVYTLVSPKMRAHFQARCQAQSLPTVDLLGPLLVGLAGHFGHEAKAVAGLLHNVNEAYFHRIDAMEYTIAHDDGRDLTGLEKADVIIMGISRTSKTPLSMYLSHQGWKVANIPLIFGFGIPEEVMNLDQRRVICLTINPEDLTLIRRARLARLGHDRGGDYADPEKVNQEIEYAADLFRQNRKWTVFNVTGKALEETASEIIKLMASRRLTPPHFLENMPPAAGAPASLSPKGEARK